MDEELWSLDELERRVAQALAAEAVRAPNGRVRARPDGRVIRWYATIGLLDRPIIGRGRAVRYGPRHLLQLVAIKRLQARGRSLAEIQAELTGATDATLLQIADLPLDWQEEQAPEREEEQEPAQRKQLVPAPAPATATGASVSAHVEPPAAARPARFWTAQPTVAHPVRPGETPQPAAAEPLALRYLIALSDTVTLAVPALPDSIPPDSADLAAIRAAAAPLLDLLADRGLTTPQGA